MPKLRLYDDLHESLEQPPDAAEDDERSQTSIDCLTFSKTSGQLGKGG